MLFGLLQEENTYFRKYRKQEIQFFVCLFVCLGQLYRTKHIQLMPLIRRKYRKQEIQFFVCLFVCLGQLYRTKHIQLMPLIRRHYYSSYKGRQFQRR